MNTSCPHCRLVASVDPSQAGTMVICPGCGGKYQVPWGHAPMTPAYHPPSYGPQNEVKAFASKKVAAGVCGILVGCFGVHKFILGFNGAGAVMLSISLIGIITGMCLIIPIIAVSVMSIIGLIEGIMYLSKSDEEFYQTYAIQRKEWF